MEKGGEKKGKTCFHEIKILVCKRQSVRLIFYSVPEMLLLLNHQIPFIPWPTHKE